MEKESLIIGITWGAFEYVHIGHINLLRRAKEQCDVLIVCVSDDEYIERHKGHIPIFSIEERIEAINGIKYVDIVTVQSSDFTKKDAVETYYPDVIFVGDDWTPETFTGANLGVKVIYLPRTKGISSTLIREGDLQ